MKIDEIAQLLAGVGLTVRWLTEANGEPMRALLTDGSSLDLSVDGAVVLPDVHLGVGAGDSFQESDPSRTTRFERFLGALTQLRDGQAPNRCVVVQLGDFYDLMRASDPAFSFAARLQAILGAYPEVAKLSSALPLLHCIGNHDHELWDHRAELSQLGIDAHIARSLGPGVLAFHGNDLVSLANVQLDVEYQTWLLSLLQTVINMPLVGGAVEALQRYFDASLKDPIFADVGRTSLPWPAAGPGTTVPPNWSAPWIMRDGASQLGQPLLGWEQSVQHDLQLAIVGHSHRPGISPTQVADGQWIPLVDVGSWTYGRTHFGIVGTDGIGVAELAP